jgi:hypothetical protein
MLTNAYTDEKDQQALEDTLKETGKKDYTELSVSEASKLITRLIDRDVVYTFICGERKTIERWEAHGFDAKGEIDACLHHCPRNAYVGECPEYLEYEERIYENLEDEE